ncbi:hypothetical protein JHK84_037257 [Glycine max]|nr:hypothetical protein JHK85_037604 [Glycine max]KAG5130860.1 hypothetical protein JHK84_037257 [Glycine max]
MGKVRGLSLLSLGGCFDGCYDHTQAYGLGTRIWNFSDRPVELQIRVGSILKKVHTLKPGSCKRLRSKRIYKAYMPGGGSMRMVKQQYISLENLRDSSEIRILRDQQRGCISVLKRTRPDFC